MIPASFEEIDWIMKQPRKLEAALSPPDKLDKQVGLQSLKPRRVDRCG